VTSKLDVVSSPSGYNLDPEREPRGWFRLLLRLDAGFARIDTVFLVVAMVACALLPTLDFILRISSLPTSPWFIRIPKYCTLGVAMVGAALAARQGSHIALDLIHQLVPQRFAAWFRCVADSIGALVCIFLGYGALMFVMTEYAAGSKELDVLPGWIVAALIPWGFLSCAYRFLMRAMADRWWLGLVIVLVALTGTLPDAVEWFPEYFPTAGEGALHLVTLVSDWAFEHGAWVTGLILIAGLVTGMPLFAVLGGAATLGFWVGESPIGVVSVSVYQLLDAPALVTLPLFTLMGAVLAKSDAPGRLVRVARAWLGWAPGGLAVAAVVVCAFFTTFSGASGVTILALGVLLHQMLCDEGYGDHLSVGLVTSSGSIGLLFAPALPLIMYGIFAKVDIDHMFVAGLLPGLLLIIAVSGTGVFLGRRSALKSHPFVFSEAVSAAREAMWEIILPVLILGLLVLGFADVTTAAAVGAVYTLIVAGFIHKDVDLKKDMGDVVCESGVVIGAVLVIVGLALGFVAFLVDQEVPQMIIAWAQENISSRWVFLLGTNLLLLVVGCLLDILSAIVIFVPLIVPVAVSFGVDPVHMGIIFLANLEIGYLTPPVGMNLFLASFRFKRPLPTIWKTVVPFLLVLFVALLIITYVPFLSTGLLDLTGSR
jgi:tripartite ATP-independent transporter DctM subunit